MGTSGPTPDQIFRLGLTYFKENEGRTFHLQFEEKLRLVALTQQANHGDISNCNLPPLGTLDVIGKQRRTAWAHLGDMAKEEAKLEFIREFTRIVPSFSQYQADQVAAAEQQSAQSLEAEQETKLMEERARETQLEKQSEEIQRRNIQDVLNKQTFEQFKSYAEQQYPDSPDQQAVLIRQLQEQHYYQYMQQVYQQQATRHPEEDAANPEEGGSSSGGGQLQQQVPPVGLLTNEPAATGEPEAEKVENGEEERRLEAAMNGLHIPDDEEGDEEEGEDVEGAEGQKPEIEIEEASIWTRKDINDFKEMIKKEEGDAIIKVGHGESVTVRVPTHKDGRSLYWEFATDHYDIGFGLFFEWVEVEDTQVTVHISDSEDDEEDEEYISEEEGGGGSGGRSGAAYDPETGKRGLLLQDSGPPTSCIVPIYRRDCYEEVYAGSHTYPGQGVYLLKFDNSYSLWRSKTLYYRVYYTR